MFKSSFVKGSGYAFIIGLKEGIVEPPASPRSGGEVLKKTGSGMKLLHTARAVCSIDEPPKRVFDPMFLETMPVHAVNCRTDISAARLRTAVSGRVMGLTEFRSIVFLGVDITLGPPKACGVSALFT